ncbi:DUF480 domain-containing protein, partial [Stenotrophomonas sp.]
GLLLLRGPQTVNELLTRSERLFQFQDADELRHHVERMIQRGLAVQLPRASGQREDRYMHLLAGPVDVEALAEAYKAAPTSGGGGSAALDARVQQLEATVAELQEQLADLRAQLGG